eukprot:TRINITY_DN664_c0_g3_i1.p2 TRINITY_DN664_c0_g3~~TRINITY_DN664_c0_g3_i1.p2  ORF type:complete len:113 (+),score=53.82 TRINITY_DN664_c0_g3_i1:57-395(+)
MSTAVTAVVPTNVDEEEAPAPQEETAGVVRDTQFGGDGATPHCVKEKGDLGPVVINTDGTMSRIKNWLQMTPAEQEQTKRVVLARNASRRAKLEADELSKEEAKDSSAAPSA